MTVSILRFFSTVPMRFLDLSVFLSFFHFDVKIRRNLRPKSKCLLVLDMCKCCLCFCYLFHKWYFKTKIWHTFYTVLFLKHVFYFFKCWRYVFFFFYFMSFFFLFCKLKTGEKKPSTGTILILLSSWMKQTSIRLFHRCNSNSSRYCQHK